MTEELKQKIAELPGWMSKCKAEALHDLVKKANAKVSVELGCFGMRGSLAMGSAHREIGGVYFGIDAYDAAPCLEGKTNPDHNKYWAHEVDFESIFSQGMTAVIGEGLIKWVNILKLRTDEANILFKRIDVLFIDGNPTEEGTCNDVMNYAPLVVEGGFMVLNDSNWLDWKSKAKNLILHYGFAVHEVVKETCNPNSEFTIYQKIKQPSSPNDHPEVIGEEAKEIIKQAEKETMNDNTSTTTGFIKDETKPFLIYDPYARKPCHEIPKNKVDVAAGMQLGWLHVTPMLLYIPDTEYYQKRWKAAQEHFREVGIENVLEVPGTHGTTLGIKTEHTYDRDNPGTGYTIGSGYVSEWLNVYMLYNIMRFLPGDHFFKLECDAQFIADWKHHFEANIDYVPKDFDMLWVGSCCLQDKLNKPIGGSVYQIDKETGFPNCGQAYIISKKCLEYVIQTQRDCYVQSDLSLMFHTLPDLKCYAMFPHLSNQRDNNLPL